MAESSKDNESKIVKIEINFPVYVSLPVGFERILDSLISSVCEQYQMENPTRVMWPAGCGGKPIWQEPEEPDFDMSVYCIEVAEREDLYGRNPLNPAAPELRKKQHEELNSPERKITRTIRDYMEKEEFPLKHLEAIKTIVCKTNESEELEETILKFAESLQQRNLNS